MSGSNLIEGGALDNAMGDQLRYYIVLHIFEENASKNSPEGHI